MKIVIVRKPTLLAPMEYREGIFGARTPYNLPCVTHPGTPIQSGHLPPCCANH